MNQGDVLYPQQKTNSSSFDKMTSAMIETADIKGFSNKIDIF